ncbi:MAG: HD domain-containing protein [Lachnospiraceae bacterium]
MDFAKQAHEGQKWTLPDGRDISYFEGHLMGVYHIVEEDGVQDDELLVTALLHDILEDTQVTEKQLRNMFGIRIADNVKWLTRREGLSYEQYIDELLVHGSDEARLVKLADRLHNTNNLMNLGSEQWHEKKIDQAKYMLDKFPEREFAEKYRETAEKLMQTIKTEVERLEENAGR